MKKSFVITIVFLIICSLVSTVLIYIANNQVLDNAKILGEEIAGNLVNLEERAYISNYKELLETVAKEINTNSYISLQDMNEIHSKFEKIITSSQIDIYIVKEQKMYVYKDTVQESNLDYKQTDWYIKAIEANGEMISTDVYEKQTTGERVITFAMKANGEDVVAANIYIDKITNWPSIENLPEGARYYICDSQGNVLHAETAGLALDETQTENYVNKILREVKEKQDDEKSYVVDVEGEKRGVYYAKTSTDWGVIVTIPYSYLLRGIDKISLAYYGAIALFVILAIYLIVAERKSNKKNSLYNRITKALGDAYYALYLVDIENETYSMLKASEYVKESIPQTGDYQIFMNCLETVIEKEAYQEFKETFSISNIKKLVSKNVKSFGGDFKRIFNKSETRWVNVQMLYNASDLKKEGHEIVLAFQDINYEKERELEKMQIIRDSIEATEEAVKSKNTFFANMSHDMRTPLNAIINLSELSKEQMDNKEKLSDYLTKINISSRQLLDLINDILDVSKMEEGINTVNKEKFNIETRLKETLSVFEEQAKLQNKNLKVVYNIQNNYVSGDWGKVRQIINNIVSNALKYTMPNGNIIVQITELVGKFVSKYEILVGDDGIGMSKEFLEKIYTPFARETRFHADKIAGTGLGMVIVNNNVQKLNGQIEIKSEPGKGTTFKVTIPLEITDEIPESEAKEEKTASIDLRGKRILIAEDNELNMEISTEILEMQGVIITKVTNGQEAVDKFKQSPEGSFDAILMDMQMPILNGCEATKEIRRLPRKDAKIIPIIAVTANTFAEDIVNTQKAGMNDHIAKPIDFKELQKVLAQYLKR